MTAHFSFYLPRVFVALGLRTCADYSNQESSCQSGDGCLNSSFFLLLQIGRTLIEKKVK